MDSRSSGKMPAARQPLGDASKRVNSAAPNIDYRGGPEDRENVNPANVKKPTRRSSIPVLAVRAPTAEQRGSRAPAAAVVPENLSSSHHRATPTLDARPVDHRRVSQISTVSSNASSGRGYKTHIGPWQLGKTLGKGSQARVRLARHRVSGQLVAIKIVAKQTTQLTQAGSLANLDYLEKHKPANNSEGGLRRMPLAIEREVAILKLVQHPNIVTLLDIWENRAEIYMVTEYIEHGDLFEYINSHGPLSEEEAVFYFRQMMSALEYCHSFNICHRDLKPENILLKNDGQIKIADFGMAALQQAPHHQLKTACGSPHYAAPELLRHLPYKGSAVDIWSMGVIFFAMLAGRLPFDDPDMSLMLTKAKRAQYIMPKHISREAKDLLRKILVVNGSDRITMRQMWKHPLIKKYDSLAELYVWETALPIPSKNVDAAPIRDSEVDIQILRQLKSMWHSYSEAQLKKVLAQDRLSDQKVFYWLLYNHRERQLENYNNEVPISKSDFHHLKPPNWGKRFSTCKFTQAGRNGTVKSVSKFTVISNVAEQDEVGTVRSYDPYRSSQVLKPCGSQASSAKVVVHRSKADHELRPNSSNVSHSYTSYKSVNGSFRQRSQHTGSVGQLKSTRGSTGSIRSFQTTPRAVRVNHRTKRGVHFSSVRARDRHRSQSPSKLGMSKTVGDSHLQPVAHQPKDESHHWKQELEQLGHHVASYCDEAFGTSLLSAPVSGESAEFLPSPTSLGNVSLSDFPVPPTYTVKDQARYLRSCSRPLPPLPDKSYHSLKSNATVSGAERRAVSEPIYTHQGREARALPSIVEHISEEPSRDNLPVENQGLDYLSSVENTIRVVSSSGAMMDRESVLVPAPLNVRKVSKRPSKTFEPDTDVPSPHTQRRASDGATSQTDGNHNGNTVTEKKPRVSSWFKRSSKDGASGTSFVMATDSSVPTEDTSGDANERKKKAFSFGFWKSSAAKETPKMSLTDADGDEMMDGEIPRPKTSRPNSGLKTNTESEPNAGRKIEVQQNWLARLFRVKPATRYLCFAIPRRRARQDVTILLRQWRRHGIQNLEVDKERSVIFASLGENNALNLKTVAFAIEFMTVIEHGKRGALCIARFTQERGAASSFHKVVDQVTSHLPAGVLVADKRKVNMMIKTLNS
ncbi:hypothetical protein V8F33_000907 [Rhypophila sp. PSN 637]